MKFCWTLYENYAAQISQGKASKKVLLLNFIWKSKKPKIVKTTLYNKETSGGIIIPDFKLYYRATVLKIAWYWPKNRQEDQWNQIKDPDINPQTFENLIFDEEGKNQMGKKSIFNK